MDKADIVQTLAENLLPEVLDALTPTIMARDVTAESFTKAFLSNGISLGYYTTTPLLPEQIVANCSAMFASTKATIFTDKTADDWTVFKTEKGVAMWGGGFDAQAQEYLVVISPRESNLSTVVICFLLPNGVRDLFGVVKKKGFERIVRVADLIQPNSGLLLLENR